MLIIKTPFFGRIERTSDLATAKHYFSYSIGRVISGELIFEGAAGDETEAVDTVNAYLAWLLSGHGLDEGASRGTPQTSLSAQG